MTHNTPVLDGAAFRGYADDVSGSITEQTALAAANTNWSQDVDNTFHVALVVEETANGAVNYAAQLQYNLNSAGWVAVGATTPIQATTPTNCTTADANIYTTSTALADAGSVVEGEYDTDGISGNTSLDLTRKELTSCLTIDSAQVANDDTFQLRLTDGGTANDTDTNIPTITIVDTATTTFERTAASNSVSTLTAARKLTRNRSAATVSASRAKINWTSTTNGRVDWDSVELVGNEGDLEGNLGSRLLASTSTPVISGTMEVGQVLTVSDAVNYYPDVTIASVSTMTAAATVGGGGTTFERDTAMASVSRAKVNWSSTTSGDVAYDVLPVISGTMTVGQTLSLADEVTYQGAVAVASSSTLTVTATVDAGGTTFERAAAIDSVSTLTADRTITRDRDAAITSASTMAAVAEVTTEFQRTAAIASASALTAVATVTTQFERAAAIASASTLTVDRTITRDRAVVVSGVSSLTVAATVTTLFERTAAIISASTLVAVAAVTSFIERSAAIASDSTLTAVSTKTSERTAAITSNSTLTAVGDVNSGFERTVSVNSVSSLTAIGTKTAERAAAIAGTSSLTAEATVSSLIERSVAVLSQSTMTAARTITRGRSVAISSASTMAATATVTSLFERAATTSSVSTFTAERTLTRGRSAGIVSASTLTATATVTGQAERTAAITSTSRAKINWETTTSGLVSFDASPAISGTMSVGEVLTLADPVTYEASVAIASVSDVTVTAFVPGQAEASIISESRLKANWDTTTSGAVSFDANPAISGTMTVGQTLTLNDAVTYEAAAAIASTSTVAAVATVLDPLNPVVAINAVSTVTVADGQVSTAPVLSGGILDTGPDPDELDWTTDQNGTLYWAVFPVAATPTPAQIIAGGDYKAGTIVVTGLSGSAQLNLDNVPNGNFEIHAVLQNASGANSNIVETAVTVSGNTWPVAINAVSTVTVADGTVTTGLERTAAISSASTLTATATVTAQRTASIASVSTITATATTFAFLERSAAIVSASTFAAAATVTTQFERSVAVAGVSSLTAVGSVTTSQIERSAAISGSSTFTAESTSNLARACQIIAQSQITATGQFIAEVRYAADQDSSGLGGCLDDNDGSLQGIICDDGILAGYIDPSNRTRGRIDHG